MKVLVLYGSTRRSTSQVVNKLPQYLTFDFDRVNVKELNASTNLRDYDLLLFLAPTYGDGELQEDMERFLSKLDTDLDGIQYAICELGNYYGYDDFAHGAMPIIQAYLKPLNAAQMIPPASIDSLPQKDWRNLEAWCERLNSKLNRE